eukprot:4364132-Heterocapsa_arctica.AAC.1
MVAQDPPIALARGDINNINVTPSDCILGREDAVMVPRAANNNITRIRREESAHKLLVNLAPMPPGAPGCT